MSKHILAFLDVVVVVCMRFYFSFLLKRVFKMFFIFPDTDDIPPQRKSKTFLDSFCAFRYSLFKNERENLIHVVFQGKCTIFLLDSWGDGALTLVTLFSSIQ